MSLRRLLRGKYDPHQYWQSRGSTYAKFLQDRPQDAAQVTFLQSHIENLNPESILEVGCGPGRLSAAFDVLYTGVDFSPNMMGEYKAAARMSGTHIGFRDNTFDATLTCVVLLHIPPSQILGVIKELGRVARRYVILFEVAEIRGRQKQLHQHDYPRVIKEAGLTLLYEAPCPELPRDSIYVASPPQVL